MHGLLGGRWLGWWGEYIHTYMYVCTWWRRGIVAEEQEKKKKKSAQSGGYDCGGGETKRHGRRCVHCTQSISPIFSFPSLFIDSHIFFFATSLQYIYNKCLFFHLEHGFSSSSLLSCPLLCCHFFVLWMFYLRSYGILNFFLRLLCWSMWVARWGHETDTPELLVISRLVISIAKVAWGGP